MREVSRHNADAHAVSLPSLSGKVAFITGGGRGIGAAIARRFAREGAAVCITYVTSAQEAASLVADIEREGGRAMALQAEGADMQAIQTAIRAAAEHFGKIDVLVNNAGMLHVDTIDKFPVETMQRMLAVNVAGVFVAIQESMRFMPDGGRVINIGSITSDYVPIAGASVYATTKGALASMTRALARDLGTRGITVNNIQPGRIDTDMNPADGPMAGRLSASIALGHYGEVEDVASLAAFLAGPEAKFITGANMKVDGGTSL
ncbi:oxidoreductase [Pandoraea capi]|uniref:Oxidoreductase n=1 Tax=Pandoraea capi TaxID=2508286 RepID=A0ABY6W848_9BURK|nr:SDR family oxidoreductase [Pandoraea capi]VVE29017.1 oxidoreductase [Pandoraea capi]